MTQVGAGPDIGLHPALGLLDHEVHVEGEAGPLPDGLDDGRADGEVGDEVAVHHVHVEQVRAARLHARDGLAERGEVGGQDARRDAGHALTILAAAGAPRAIAARSGALGDRLRVPLAEHDERAREGEDRRGESAVSIMPARNASPPRLASSPSSAVSTITRRTAAIRATRRKGSGTSTCSRKDTCTV